MPTCFWQVTAACCLMLAGKVEETPKKVRDIVKTARSLLSDADFEQFGSDPREEVMAFERVLLKTIKFDLQVSHPYSYLLQFAKRIKGNQEKLKELVQMSWSFINDSLATTLCLQWEPEIVACAVLYLATRMSKFTIEDWEGRQPGQRWWECFVEGMSTEVSLLIIRNMVTFMQFHFLVLFQCNYYHELWLETLCSMTQSCSQ
ncbi:Cyclin-K [Schistosoma japonicum]|nr:Cyclin-K [Schistosoma japonicum]KAH8855858.1 Cyclin-K [Schistosoma japonicum]